MHETASWPNRTCVVTSLIALLCSSKVPGNLVIPCQLETSRQANLTTKQRMNISVLLCTCLLWLLSNRGEGQAWERVAATAKLSAVDSRYTGQHAKESAFDGREF